MIRLRGFAADEPLYDRLNALRSVAAASARPYEHLVGNMKPSIQSGRYACGVINDEIGEWYTRIHTLGYRVRHCGLDNRISDDCVRVALPDKFDPLLDPVHLLHPVEMAVDLLKTVIRTGAA